MRVYFPEAAGKGYGMKVSPEIQPSYPVPPTHRVTDLWRKQVW